MPPATLKQSDLTRYLKAWKTAWGSEPVCRITPDGTTVLTPVVDAERPSEGELTPLEKWKAENAS